MTGTSEVYTLLSRCAGVNFDTKACSYLAPKPVVYMADSTGAVGQEVLQNKAEPPTLSSEG